MSLPENTPSPQEIIRPGNRFINEGVLGGFVYKVIQENEQQVTAIVYPYGLARGSSPRGEKVDLPPETVQKFRKISLHEAKPYETGEIV